jgi:hypothetical protein
MMTGSWRRPAEQILLTSLESGHRTIGFTAPNVNAGVSTLSQVSAEIFARSGFKTLLLDLTQPMRDPFLAAGWAPGHGDAKKWIARHERGFDYLIARPTPETQFAFNNVASIRELLTIELADYAKILLDLPPLSEQRTDPINPHAAAAACDSVLLVCVRGQLAQSRLESAVKAAKAAGCKMTGVVLNDVNFVPAPVQIARLLRSFIRPGPRLADWLERKIPPVD